MEGVRLRSVQTRRRLSAAACSALVAVAVLVVQGCASVGERVGRESTEGALSEFQKAVEGVPAEQQGIIAERNAKAAVRAALEELDSPEGKAHLRRVIDQAISQAFQSAVDPWSETGRRGEGTGGSGRGGAAPPMEELGRQFAYGLTNAVVRELMDDLGGDGSGEFSQAMAASAERLSASATLGMRKELESFIGPCSDPDPRKCLERRMHELGKAASAGAMEGLRVPLLLLTFVFGFLVCLLMMMLLGAGRRRGARGQAAEVGRKSVPA